MTEQPELRTHQRQVVRRFMRRLARTSSRVQPGVSKPSFAARTFWHSVGYALEGLWFAFQQERNLRLHLLLQLLMAIAGLWVGLPLIRWVGLVQVGTMILFSEMANTILEWLVDLLTDGHYDLRAKRIKDMAAGTCLMVATVGYSVMACLLWFG